MPRSQRVPKRIVQVQTTPDLFLPTSLLTLADRPSPSAPCPVWHTSQSCVGSPPTVDKILSLPVPVILSSWTCPSTMCYPALFGCLDSAVPLLLQSCHLCLSTFVTPFYTGPAPLCSAVELNVKSCYPFRPLCVCLCLSRSRSGPALLHHALPCTVEELELVKSQEGAASSVAEVAALESLALETLLLLPSLLRAAALFQWRVPFLTFLFGVGQPT